MFLKYFLAIISSQPIPWVSYHLFKELDKRDYSKECVVEFGSGLSTLYFLCKGAKKLISFESDGVWYENIKQIVEPFGAEKIDLLIYNKDGDMSQEAKYAIDAMAGFSSAFVFVDGGRRRRIVREVLSEYRTSKRKDLPERVVIYLDDSRSYFIPELESFDVAVSKFWALKIVGGVSVSSYSVIEATR